MIAPRIQAFGKGKGTGGIIAMLKGTQNRSHPSERGHEKCYQRGIEGRLSLFDFGVILSRFLNSVAPSPYVMTRP